MVITANGLGPLSLDSRTEANREDYRVREELWLGRRIAAYQFSAVGKFASTLWKIGPEANRPPSRQSTKILELRRSRKYYEGGAIAVASILANVSGQRQSREYDQG